MVSPTRPPHIHTPGIGLENSVKEHPGRLAKAMVILAAMTICGTVGFVWIEEWDLWRAFYFTLVTITTVGYGDEGISENGEKFASFLLIGGVASASYAFATIVQSSIASQFAWKSKMQREIQKLRGHTIVCGFGRMGRSICEEFSTQGHAFVVLERDALHVEQAIQQGYLAVQGTASEDSVLLEAGIDHASHIIAAVDSIADNIVIVMGARDLNASITIIARAERDGDVKKLERAGVNRVLCPFRSGGREAVDFVVRPQVADFLARASMGGGDIALADIHVAEGSELVGVTLAEYGRDRASQVSFVALHHSNGSTVIPPRGKQRLEAGDHLIVAGDPEQISTMNKLAQLVPTK